MKVYTNTSLSPDKMEHGDFYAVIINHKGQYCPAIITYCDNGVIKAICKGDVVSSVDPKDIYSWGNKLELIRK